MSQMSPKIGIKPLLKKPKENSPPQILPQIDESIRRDVKSIKNNESSLQNQYMTLDNNQSFSFSVMSAVNSSCSQSEQSLVETEVEEIIITDKRQIQLAIKDRFDESQFNLKHMQNQVRDLENRVQSLYENGLYVLLSEQRRWYTALKQAKE